MQAERDKEFDELLRGGFSKDKMFRFFSARPHLILRRFFEIGQVLIPTWRIWNDPLQVAERGEFLKGSLQKLGPVFVKVGQTLAQRPDIVGDDVAEILKSLQSKTKPFPDEIAHRIILEDLNHTGPLAPNVADEFMEAAGSDPFLFTEMSPQTIASASLGQVYKAKTREGLDIALKVMRPGVTRLVACDWVCWFLALKLQRLIFGSFNDFAKLADGVAGGVFLELDYHNEGRNMEDFVREHMWLGFVTAPDWIREYTGPKGNCRVLATQWANGLDFSELPGHLRHRAVRLAAEACLVQLLITGFIHADPHEGNLKYMRDGRICFLDFGLMDRVPARIMEGFADGIRSVVSQNWTALAHSMQVVECVPDPVKRNLRPNSTRPLWVDTTFKEFVDALGEEVGNDQDAQSRFGDLAAALKRLSSRYLMLTPDYVVLMTRTFVTLEGIASVYDPEFNIYTTALPITLRRLVSPSTKEARANLRNNVLTETGEVKWSELQELLKTTEGSSAHEGDEDAEMTLLDAEDSQPSSSASGFRPLEGLLGSSEGQCLRRMAYDIDLNALFNFLASRDAKFLRKQVAIWLASWFDFRKPNLNVTLSDAPPVGSEEYEKLQKHRAQRDRKALRFILRSQWNRLHFRALPSLVLAVVVFLLRVSGTTLILILRRWARAIAKWPTRWFGWMRRRRHPQVLTS